MFDRRMLGAIVGHGIDSVGSASRNRQYKFCAKLLKVVVGVTNSDSPCRFLQERSGSSVPPILNRMDTVESPPTYNRTNKFTTAFQALIDAYGVANYREVNPSKNLWTLVPEMFLEGHLNEQRPVGPRVREPLVSESRNRRSQSQRPAGPRARGQLVLELGICWSRISDKIHQVSQNEQLAHLFVSSVTQLVACDCKYF